MLLSLEKGNNKQILIKFKYSDERVEKMHQIRRCFFDPKIKEWRMPFNKKTIVSFYDLFQDEEIILDRTFEAYYDDNDFKYIDFIYRYDYLNKAGKELILKGYSKRTERVYLSHIKRFLEFQNKIPDSIGENDIRDYLLFLFNEKEASYTYINQSISAIKFLYKNVFNKDYIINSLPRPKKRRKLPSVLSKKEVFKIVTALKNCKHRAILSIVYSSGLRVSEVVRLKEKDIDEDRMMVHIEQGKGNKDRYTVLSEMALKAIDIYKEKYLPENWLFPGNKENSHISERTVQRIFKNACKKANIKKNVSVHSLRHSFATHLLENGVDLRYIQELLGHKHSRTTEIYTHVSNFSIKRIKSPLDEISISDED